MSYDNNCVFCKIIQGQIPSAKIYEDDKVLAFLDIAPLNFGHTVVIPKGHFAGLTVIPTEYLNALMAAIQKIAPAVMRATGAEGFNLVLNNGSVAGQVVAHAHFHIIPRLVNDAVVMPTSTKQYGDGEMAEMAAAIQKKLAERETAE